MENDKEKTPLSEAKKSLAGVQQALKSMSGEYALLSGYLGKISAGVNQSATVMNTFKTVMQQSGETVKKTGDETAKAADQMNAALTDSAEQAGEAAKKAGKETSDGFTNAQNNMLSFGTAMTSAVSLPMLNVLKTAMGVGAGVSGEFQGMQGLIMASAGGISDSLQGELQGALTQMNQSFEAAAQVIQSVMAPGMEILVQVVITVVKGITALVNLFIKLPKPVQVFIVAIMGILAAIGPMLIMVTMAQQKFQQFSAGLALVQGNIGKLGGGLSKLSASFSALGGGPLILIVAAVLAAVAAFIYFYKTNETFRNSINSLASAIQGAVSAAFGKLVGLLQQIQPAFQQVMQFLNNFLQ